MNTTMRYGKNSKLPILKNNLDQLRDENEYLRMRDFARTRVFISPICPDVFEVNYYTIIYFRNSALSKNAFK